MSDDLTSTVIPVQSEHAGHACPNPDPLLSVRGAAEYLGLVGLIKHPDQTILRLCRLKRVQFVRIVGKVMFRRSWLEAYLQENANRPQEHRQHTRPMRAKHR